jgi:hypothetical protein
MARSWYAMQSSNAPLLGALLKEKPPKLKEPAWKAYYHIFRAADAESQARGDIVIKELYEAIKDVGKDLYLPWILTYAQHLPGMLTDQRQSQKMRRHIQKWLPWAGEIALLGEADNPSLQKYLAEAASFEWDIPRPVDSGLPAKSVFAKAKLGVLWDKMAEDKPLSEKEGIVLSRLAEEKNPVALAALAVLLIPVHEFLWPVALEYLTIVGNDSAADEDLQLWAALYAGELAGRVRADWDKYYDVVLNSEKPWVVYQAAREYAYFAYIRGQKDRVLPAIEKSHQASVSLGMEEYIYPEHLFYAHRLGSKESQARAEMIHSHPTQKTPANILSSSIDEEALAKAMQELNGLIGLATVKEQVDGIRAMVEQVLRRQELGHDTGLGSQHMLFIGPAGTGKTTVARIVARIYHALGVLPEPKCIEVDRKDLVGEYIGSTAVKTDKVIDRAIGGVLFIDEAYTLAGESNDFGAEALATIMKRMEDERSKFIVIMAGYPDEMEKLLQINSGLESRFPHRIDFQQYSDRELIQLYLNYVRADKYKIERSAAPVIMETVRRMLERSNPRSFGNGRAIRTMYEKTLILQARRISKIKEPTPEIINLIQAEDIPKLK